MESLDDIERIYEQVARLEDLPAGEFRERIRSTTTAYGGTWAGDVDEQVRGAVHRHIIEEKGYRWDGEKNKFIHRDSGKELPIGEYERARENVLSHIVRVGILILCKKKKIRGAKDSSWGFCELAYSSPIFAEIQTE